MTDLEQDLYIANARIKELETELKRLKEANRWISVEERLPEDKQLCLCVCNLWDKTPVIDVFEFLINPPDFWCIGKNRFWDYDSESGYFERNDVTHWRPLPEPPEPEKPTHKRGICSPTKLPCSECMPTTCDCETKEE